jgi:protein CMS1
VNAELVAGPFVDRVDSFSPRRVCAASSNFRVGTLGFCARQGSFLLHEPNFTYPMSRTKGRRPGLRAQQKRKRDLDEAGDADPVPVADAKRTKTGTNNTKNLKKDNIKAAKSEHENLSALDAVLDPSLLVDLFAKCIRKSFPNDPSNDLDGQYLPAKAFLDTTSYSKDRVAKNLPDFLETFSAGGKDSLSTCDKKAAPHTLVVTASGMRTADVYRELRVYQNEISKVGKLIAKHMKLKENIEYIQENRVGIAISTPFRFKQLIDAGALNPTNLRRIVVDASYHDDKKNTIFTLDQTFRPLVSLLNEEDIRQRYGLKDKTEILIF